MIYDLNEEEVKTIVWALESRRDEMSGTTANHDEQYNKIIAYLESKLEKK